MVVKGEPRIRRHLDSTVQDMSVVTGSLSKGKILPGSTEQKAAEYPKTSGYSAAFNINAK